MLIILDPAPHFLGMFFTEFTLMNPSVCAWQQHSDAFREHSGVFRDAFSALGYPRLMCPSTWCALFLHPCCPRRLPLQPVRLPRAAALQGSFHTLDVFLFLPAAAQEKLEGWEGNHRCSFALYCPSVAHNAKLMYSGTGSPTGLLGTWPHSWR